MSEAMLLEVIAEAPLDPKRTLRVLERRTQSQDHPILLTVPETHYLKCPVLEVVYNARLTLATVTFLTGSGQGFAYNF